MEKSRLDQVYFSENKPTLLKMQNTEQCNLGLQHGFMVDLFSAVFDYTLHNTCTFFHYMAYS